MGNWISNRLHYFSSKSDRFSSSPTPKMSFWYFQNMAQNCQKPPLFKKSKILYFQHFSLVPTPPKSIKWVWKVGLLMRFDGKKSYFMTNPFLKHDFWHYFALFWHYFALFWTILALFLYYFALFCTICALFGSICALFCIIYSENKLP